MKAYAGIGSRETPQESLELFESIAIRLAWAGWTLRTGGADGADNAFLKGCREAGGLFELYLPWNGFNDHESGFLPYDKSFELAAAFHPGWRNLSQGGRALHARNVHQILGQDLDKLELSVFVMCYTDKGKGGGGTGQALRIARAHDVPIIDTGSSEGLAQAYELLDDLRKL